MAMGKRTRDRQPPMWVATTELPTAASHPFYSRLNQLLREQGFDDFAERACAEFYAETMGRPGLAPGIYFRLLLVGYFEGLDSERGIAWRAADSLTLRDFLGLTLPETPPDHSTISRTRRLIDLETHRAVFTWVLARLTDAGLVIGQTIGVDATTLEANAALRSIPVIALTAHAMRGDAEKAKECGCDDYLSKPLDEDLLFEKLTQFLGEGSRR